MSNEERVKRVIIEQLCVPELRVVPAADWDSLGADSLDLVELTMAIEDEFNIEIDDEVIEKVGNVAELVNLINEITETV